LRSKIFFCIFGLIF